MKTYMLWLNNSAIGPATIEKLKELLAANKISLDSLVIEASKFQGKSSNNAWVKLGKVLSETISHSSVSVSSPLIVNSSADRLIFPHSKNLLRSYKDNDTSPYKLTLLKSLAFLIVVILGIALSLVGIFSDAKNWQDAQLAEGFLFFCIFVATPVVLYALFQKSTLRVFNVNMFLVIVCSLFFVVAWNKKTIPKQLRPPGLSYESKNLRDSWSYQNTNRDVAMALLERFDTELEIQAKAEFDGDAKNARDHAQRAADYLMAAKVFYSTGKYPPGFDSDLATK